MEKEIFSVIPMRTWRWLGVNEALLPEELLQKQPQKAEEFAGERSVINTIETQNETAIPAAQRQIHVSAGKREDVTITWRTEQRSQIVAEVEEGGTLNLICVQTLPSDKAYAGEVTITAGEKAKVTYTAVEAGASEALTKLQINLAGDGSAADVAAVYFGDKERKIDLNYVITHTGRNTEADMQVRGALKDSCDKIFRGTLDFRHGCRGSAGREKEEVILFNEGIRNRSVPLMLSGEDEVSGHHAVSAGRMDKDKLFYLMSRGLDENAAQKLLVEALFLPVLARIPDPALREEITKDLEERIADGRQ